MSQLIPVACARNCYDNCRLIAEVSDGKIVRVKASNDLITRGILCPKAIADPMRIYSRSRVLYPYVRTVKGFKKVSWDEALSLVTSRLGELLNNPSEILYLEYGGNIGLMTRYFSRRLWHFIKAAVTDYSICDAGGEEALKLMYGSTYGILPKDYSRVKLFIFWGFNPVVSAPHMFNLIKDVRSRGGASIVTIDIRSSETAKLSDVHVRIKPGSDGVLALGIANYLISEGKIDEEFIKKYVHGFKKFSEHVSKYDLRTVEELTGVPRDEVTDLAEALYESRPFCILMSYGLQRRVGGGEIVRSIASLPAILGVHRGFYYGNRDGLYLDYKHIQGLHLWSPSRVISMQKVGKYLARGDFKFVYVHLTNPAATLPNSNKVVEGLKRSDVFVVVHDTHWSDTAKLADVVLPAPTFYEKRDVVCGYWHNYIYLNEPVIKPLGYSLSEAEVMGKLAEQLNLSSSVVADPLKVIREAVGDEVFSKLLREGVAEIPYRPLSEYQTPTGKIELYSTSAAARGLSPLPNPPSGEVLSEGEYLLITSAHPHYMHTQFEDVYGVIPSDVTINDSDARKLGVSDRDVVELYNEFGRVLMRVKVSSDVPQGVLWSPRHAEGVDGKRVSVLMSDDVEEVGEGSVLNSTRVKVRKVKRVARKH